MTRRFAFLAVALALAACAERTEPPPAPTSNPFIGTEWAMVGGGADAPTIEFSETRASGHTGCNRWFAQVTSHDPMLTFTAIGTTRRMCEATLMQTERAFVAALRDAHTARIEGDTLVLRDVSGAELARFEQPR